MWRGFPPIPSDLADVCVFASAVISKLIRHCPGLRAVGGGDFVLSVTTELATQRWEITTGQLLSSNIPCYRGARGHKRDGRST